MLVLGRLASGSGPLGLGIILVGVLPTDVSSPLLVLIVRGNVALATVFNAINTALAPVSNADTIIDAPVTVAGVAGVALALNVIGYLVGATTRPLLPERADRTAMLCTVSKKEFSIAAFVVFASGLPPQVAIPAVVYAVVQMLNSLLVAKRLARHAIGSQGRAAVRPRFPIPL